MKTTSWEQIRAILRSVSGALGNRIDKLGALLGKTQEGLAQTEQTANEAIRQAKTANDGLANKLDANNPVASGAARFGQKGTAQNIGDNSFAAGQGVDAAGSFSAAFNSYSSASAMGSFAANESHATGGFSFGEGYRTYSRGYYSHVEGSYTDARGMCQHVQGYCNVIDKENGPRENSSRYLHIVGNGDFDEEGREVRSNAHTLDWDGNAWFAGDLYVGGTSQDDASKVLTNADIDSIADAVIAKIPSAEGVGF